MKRRHLVTLPAVVAGAAFATERPNILLIVSDDQGFAELGAYMDFAERDTLGAKRLEEWKRIAEPTAEQAPIEVCFEAARKCMPNVDRLAAEGTRFTSFYAAPTCVPSRAALMSARYPQRFGVYCNDDSEGRFGQGIPDHVPFPVQLFQKAGYRTGLIGKWHLGDRPGQHPNDKGFDYYFGFNRAHTEKYGSRILYRNRENVPAEGWLEDQISEEALAFLERTEEEDVPFIARLPGGIRGQSSDSLQSIMDVLPTSLEYAGIALPESWPLDGQSFLSVLQRGDSPDPERTLFWAGDSQIPFGRDEWSPEYAALRRRMQELGQTQIRSERYPPSYYVRTPKWKLIGWDSIPPALIEIGSDLGERNDLSKQYPEVVKELSGRFAEWIEPMDKPLFYPEIYWNTLRSIK